MEFVSSLSESLLSDINTNSVIKLLTYPRLIVWGFISWFRAIQWTNQRETVKFSKLWNLLSKNKQENANYELVMILFPRT